MLRHLSVSVESSSIHCISSASKIKTDTANTTSHQYLRIIAPFQEKRISRVVEIYTKSRGLKARAKKVYKPLTLRVEGNKKGASPCRVAPF